jgi:hypothetical protein
VYDVLVYPQRVTPASVRTDRETYTDWLNALPDDVFSDLRGQAHSHAKMGTFASSQDTKDQQDTLSQLGKACPFYVFMIWNKDRKHSAWIYDVGEDITYGPSNVNTVMDGDDLGTAALMKEARRLVHEDATPPESGLWKEFA